MQIETQSVTLFLASLTVVANLWLLSLILAGMWERVKKGQKENWAKKYLDWMGINGLWMSGVVALVATMGSLFYSEVAGFTPCKLCWYQRIFMYPLVPMMLMASVNKDKRVADYGFVLSAIGAIIALYHYLIQTGVVENITECSVVGFSVSCSDNFGTTFGYITIPMMALSAFGVILALMVLVGRNNKSKK